MNLDRMITLTEGFATKADKMRVLERTGVPRADIARFLNVRYQQVRNTLEGDKRTGYDPDLIPNSHVETPQFGEKLTGGDLRQIEILEDGFAAIPPDMIDQLVEDGGVLYAIPVANGILLSNVSGMVSRVQKSFA